MTNGTPYVSGPASGWSDPSHPDTFARKCHSMSRTCFLLVVLLFAACRQQGSSEDSASGENAFGDLLGTADSLIQVLEGRMEVA